MCLLAFEGGKFGARLFGVVFVCDDSVSKPLQLRVTLANVLVEARDVVVGCFELLSKRLGARVSVLTRFG